MEVDVAPGVSVTLNVGKYQIEQPKLFSALSSPSSASQHNN
jgi:hypothetical protein